MYATTQNRVYMLKYCFNFRTNEAGRLSTSLQRYFRVLLQEEYHNPSHLLDISFPHLSLWQNSTVPTWKNQKHEKKKKEKERP